MSPCALGAVTDGSNGCAIALARTIDTNCEVGIVDPLIQSEHVRAQKLDRQIACSFEGNARQALGGSELSTDASSEAYVYGQALRDSGLIARALSDVYVCEWSPSLANSSRNRVSNIGVKTMFAECGQNLEGNVPRYYITFRTDGVFIFWSEWSDLRAYAQKARDQGLNRYLSV